MLVECMYLGWKKLSGQENDQEISVRFLQYFCTIFVHYLSWSEHALLLAQALEAKFVYDYKFCTSNF